MFCNNLARGVTIHYGSQSLLIHVLYIIVPSKLVADPVLTQTRGAFGMRDLIECHAVQVL